MPNQLPTPPAFPWTPVADQQTYLQVQTSINQLYNFITTLKNKVYGPIAVLLDDLTTANELMANTVASMRNLVDDNVTVTAQLSAEAKCATENVEAVSNDLEQTRVQLVSYRQELQQLETRVQDNTDAIEALPSDVTTIQAQVDANTANLVSLSNSLQAQSVSLQAMRSDLAAATATTNANNEWIRSFDPCQQVCVNNDDEVGGTERLLLDNMNTLARSINKLIAGTATTADQVSEIIIEVDPETGVATSNEIQYE